MTTTVTIQRHWLTSPTNEVLAVGDEVSVAVDGEEIWRGVLTEPDWTD